MRWPGKVEPLRDEETLASILDFPKTILNLARVEAPADLTGVDLRDRKSLARRQSLMVASYQHDIIDIDDPFQSLTGKAFIDGWWKLIVPGPHEETHAWAARFAKFDQNIQLYDLKNDPYEQIDLSAKYPEKVTELKEKAQEEWDNTTPYD
jgi:arylsulfatase A-like enzyme